MQGVDPNADKKKVIGGAIAGAILGQIIGSNTKGTIIGAAAGAAAGAAVAKSRREVGSVPARGLAADTSSSPRRWYYREVGERASALSPARPTLVS